MWLGTDLVFEAFTFYIVQTEYGIFQIHAYPYDETTSTFIVETDEATWRRANLDVNEDAPIGPGENDEYGLEFARATFAEILRGHELLAEQLEVAEFPNRDERALA